MVIGICDDNKGCVEELHKKIEACAEDIFDEFILSKKMDLRLFFVVFFYSEGF